MSVPDLLQFLAVGKKTGLLKFSHGKVVKGIYFEKGLIIGSTTNDPREYLGQVLLHYGKISEAQLQAAMEMQRAEDVQRPISRVQSPQGDAEHKNADTLAATTAARATPRRRLGRILVDTEVISEAELIEVLEIRTLDIIYDLFIWQEGAFEFYAADPLPADFTRVHLEPNRVVMEGVYRADELSRYRELIPSDRTVMELGSGWTSSIGLGKTTRQLLYFLEKRMSVAEISYNMHSSPFEVYGQLYELVQKGLARASGELPEASDAATLSSPVAETEDDVGVAAREVERGKGEKALSIIHAILEREPANQAAQELLVKAEQKFIAEMYEEIAPTRVPKIVINSDELAIKEMGPQEGFMLSRINGEWDVQSILSICPFREADSLAMIKKLWDKGIIGF